jgi:hypothetical protein
MLSERNNLSEKFLRSRTFMRALSPALGETSKVVGNCRSRKEAATANHRGNMLIALLENQNSLTGSTLK